MKSKYKVFRVSLTNNYVYYGREDHICFADLPEAVRQSMPEDGTYLVRRIVRGGIKVCLIPYPYHSTSCPARYLGASGLLCKALCRALAYSAKKPETIYVSIRRQGMERTRGL